MDTKELMIGDWVYCEPEAQAIRVREVRGSSVVFDHRLLIAFDNELQPIALTDDFLNANFGLPIDNGQNKKWIVCFKNVVCFSIYRWQKNSHYEALGGIPLGYIHELQHALRLCGENELADNLKLK